MEAANSQQWFQGTNPAPNGRFSRPAATYNVLRPTPSPCRIADIISSDGRGRRVMSDGNLYPLADPRWLGGLEKLAVEKKKRPTTISLVSISSPEVIRWVVMMYVKISRLSLRNVEGPAAPKRGWYRHLHETVR